MVEAAERDGLLTRGVDPHRVLVREPRRRAEHDRGQQGLPLPLRHRSALQPATRRLMEALGSQVHVVTEPRRDGRPARCPASTTSGGCARPTTGTCGSTSTPNPGNWRAHFRTTAPAIAAHFPDLDVLFVGAGTTGTLMGCARFFREWHRPVRVVAVDSVGSVTFGGAPGRRMIPGLGTSVRPPLLDESFVDDVVQVEESDTVRACHRLARRGFLFGGSTGTVVSGAMAWLAPARRRMASPRWPSHPTSASGTSTPSTRRTGSRRLYGEDVLDRPGGRDDGPRRASDPGHLSAVALAGSRARRPDDRPRTVAAAPGDTASAASGYAAALWPRSCRSTGCRSTATSSTTWAPTRWSWPGSAPACGSAPTCPPVSMKDVYRHPTIGAWRAAVAPLPDPHGLEGGLRRGAGRGARTSDQVPVDSHFFDDLGADSMVMAQFCARVRKRDDLPVGVDEGRLPAPHDQRPGARAARRAARPGTQHRRPAGPVAVPDDRAARRRSTRAGTSLCGALQVLVFVGYAAWPRVVVDRGSSGSPAGEGLLDTYLARPSSVARSSSASASLPIVAEVGADRPVDAAGDIRIWSLGYVRFWLVKTLIRLNPMVLFAGSPLYTAYLRALGATIGRGVVILTRHPPVCTDLLTIGDGHGHPQGRLPQRLPRPRGLIRTGAGHPRPGRVRRREDRARHRRRRWATEPSSATPRRCTRARSCPPGERWHGSPGEPTDAGLPGVAPAPCGTLRRAVYTFWQLVPLVLVTLPLGVGGLALLLVEVPWLAALLEPGPHALDDRRRSTSTAVASRRALLRRDRRSACSITITVPRVLNRVTRRRAGSYPLYGIHYASHRRSPA